MTHPTTATNPTWEQQKLFEALLKNLNWHTTHTTDIYGTFCTLKNQQGRNLTSGESEHDLNFCSRMDLVTQHLEPMLLTHPEWHAPYLEALKQQIQSGPPTNLPLELQLTTVTAHQKVHAFWFALTGQPFKPPPQPAQPAQSHWPQVTKLPF